MATMPLCTAALALALALLLVQIGSASQSQPEMPPRCSSRRCPNDFYKSGIAGRFPSGSDPCNASTTCVHDVLPGCSQYRGDSDAPWGVWCASSIASFDTNRTMPRNIGDATAPIYFFQPRARSQEYVLYIPPSGTLPLSAHSGRYEYFLFQWLQSKNIAVFVVQVPVPGWDGWDHVPPHTHSSPYSYNCSDIVAGYGGMCVPYCDMCEKNRSTGIIERAIDHAVQLG